MPEEIKPTESQPEQVAPDVSERTSEQFEKLLKSNQELKQEFESERKQRDQLYQQLVNSQKQYQTEVSQKGQTESVWSQAQPKTQPVQTQTPPSKKLNANDFLETDDSGSPVVNMEKLNKALEDINQTSQVATQTEKQVQDFIETQKKQEEARQLQEAYANYPQLNTNDTKYDPELAKLTRQILVDSYAYQDDYGGVPLTYRQAADRASIYINALRKGATVEEAQARADEEAKKQESENKVKTEEAKKEAETNKQQASLEARGSSQRGQEELSDTERADLVMKTRLGDNWALARRLQEVPHVGTPTSSQV